MQVFDFSLENRLKELILLENFFSKTLNLGSFLYSKGYIHLIRLVICMKQFNAFASTFRIQNLLCCSAALLLTACGGNMDAGSEQLSATAASVASDAGVAALAGSAAPAAAAETTAEAAPAEGNEAAAASSAAPAAPSTVAAPTASAAGATAPAADTSARTFELTGYDGNAQQTQAGPQDAGAHPLVSLKQ